MVTSKIPIEIGRNKVTNDSYNGPAGFFTLGLEFALIHLDCLSP